MSKQIIEIDPEKWAVGIVEAIHADLNDRKGFEIDSLDDDVAQEIKSAHVGIVRRILAAPRPEPVQPPFDPEEYRIPCDVKLPPNTRISRGCPLSTVIAAMETRRDGIAGIPIAEAQKFVQQPATSNYTAADMASQAAQGFRDGVESVNQQPAQPIPTGERLASGRILTCVYCGHEYPQDTPAHGSKVLTDHISQCEKHPMREVIDQRDKLKSALAGLIGASDSAELRNMELIIRLSPAPAADKAAMLDAIHVLLNVAEQTTGLCRPAEPGGV